jgi:hypothetical protein
VAWDRKAYSTEDLIRLLGNFNAIQTKPAWFAFFWVDVFDVATVRDALIFHGYTSIYCIHCHKRDAVGDYHPVYENEPVNAVDVLLTARNEGGARHKLTTTISSDPTECPNFITAFGPKKFLRNKTGAKINVCQKSTQVYEQLLPLFLKPGARIMVAGFGAGGEIAACIAGGYDCVAFENDPVQFHAVSNWLRNYDVPESQTGKKQSDPEMEEKKQEASQASATADRNEVQKCADCGTPETQVPLRPCNWCARIVCILLYCSREQVNGSRICVSCIQDPDSWKKVVLKHEFVQEKPGEEEKF